MGAATGLETGIVANRACMVSVELGSLGSASFHEKEGVRLGPTPLCFLASKRWWRTVQLPPRYQQGTTSNTHTHLSHWAERRGNGVLIGCQLRIGGFHVSFCFSGKVSDDQDETKKRIGKHTFEDMNLV